MTALYLAENPSQVMDIAKILGVKKREDGYLVLNNGDLITWAVGRLLELAEPQDYDESWGGYWKWGQLPMIPPAWKYTVNKRTSKQFNVIKALLKKATSVVIATDAGCEGELIAREVLDYCKYRGPIQRFWTSSLVDVDIRHALKNLKPGAETYPLYEAALARSRSDWMMGLTGTRAVSLAANVRGDFFAVGRVKTPTLAMVVRRHHEINGFVVQAYYELEARVVTAKGAEFKMNHAPADGVHITTRADIDALKTKAVGAQGPLCVVKAEDTEPPALPFSLPALQKEANRVYGFTAKNTLKLAQTLYEAKATTYPRTDCQYLAESQIAEVPGVLAAVAMQFPAAVKQMEAHGVVTRKGTFNDAKLADHHAIIPTSQHAALTGAELQLYTLITQQYLRAISPDCKFSSTKVSMDANGVLFKASGRTDNSLGWKSIKLVNSSAEEAEA